CTLIIDPGNAETVINEHGLEAGAGVEAQLFAYLRTGLRRARHLVLAGSLPAALPANFYAHSIELSREGHVPALLDATGDSLRLGLAAKPDLIKVNRAELADAVGRPLASVDDVLAAADTLRAQSGGQVIVTMGAEGAVLVTAEGRWHLSPPGVTRVNTTGIVLAKLGVDTAVVARVGSDLFGDFLVQILADHGVRPHVVREPRVPTSTSVVAVSSGGERSFMHMIGANGRLIPQDIPDDLLRATRIFHLGGCFVLPALDGEPAAGLLRRAREQGCRTSMALAWDPSGRWMSVLEPCLPHLDFLFGNQDELGHVTGRRDPAEMAGMLRERGVAAVAVKLGDAGAFVDAAGWRGRVPAYAVEVVDTTGAGDAFCGGFLAAVLAGWEME